MKGRTTYTALLAAAGFIACTSAWGAPLNGTVRDFVADGTNFEGPIIGLQTGLVGSTLVGPAPTLTAFGSTLISNTGAGAFSNWYTNTTNSTSFSLNLTETAPGSGVYTYSSNAFYPIDGQLLGNEGRSHNYHFTYAIASTFYYDQGAGQTFAFTGDDDVWVYFDNLLGIDLGGVHPAASATVNLDTLFNANGGRASGNYAFNFFFAERHTTESNLLITTTLAINDNNVPEPGTLALLGLGLAGLAAARRRRS